MRVKAIYGLLFCVVRLFLGPGSIQAETICPLGIEPAVYQPFGHSQIGIQVFVNGQGPYDFMLDTGSQITILAPSIARELNLVTHGSIGVVSVARYATTNLVDVESLVLGGHRAINLQVAVQSLDQIQSAHSSIQGILGLDFLSRFDLLIDNAHKTLCLDEDRGMRYAILGDRVAVVHREIDPQNAIYVPPILIPVRLSADGHQSTLLRIDSGTIAPLLYSSKVEILPWLKRAHASRGIISGAHSPLLLATVPEQEVQLAEHVNRRISFLTPISDGVPFVKPLEDGLLPTALFREILISFRDGFVIFNPQDACPRPERN